MGCFCIRLSASILYRNSNLDCISKSIGGSIMTGSLFERIRQPHAAIRPQVLVTPLERSSALSARLGCEVLLKCEHLQPTGSFKLRGATNKVRLLAEGARRAGVITASTGNHGQAVARAGAEAGVPVTVFVP